MYKGKNFSMGNGGEVDSALSTTSENPIQNKVVTEALNNKLNAGDIADWAKAKSKPTYTASEVGADAQGSADTALSSAKGYTDTKIADLVNSAPETLDTLGEIAEALADNKDVIEALDTVVGNKADANDLTAHIGNKNNPHEVTKSQIGLGNVPNVATNDQTPTYTDTTTFSTLTSGEKLSVAFAKIKLAISNLISHITNTSNPHSVTKSQIGLGNVENKTSATIRSELTKSDVTSALGYTPPTSDTKYTLPTATASTLGGIKTGSNITNSSGTISVTKDNVVGALGYTPPTTNTTYTVATESSNGLMSSTDKAKLNGIATGANKYTHPTTSGNKHVPSGGSSGQILRWGADGTAVWGADNNTTYSAATQSANGLMSSTDKTKLDGIATGANNYSLPAASSSVRGGVKVGYTANGKNYPVQLSDEKMFVNVPWTDNNTTYSAFKGATASAAGGSGLVPAPAAGNQTKYLRADGTWQTPPDTNTTYSTVTTSANGLMSSTDKTKLDGIAAGAQVNSITGIKGNAETSYRTGNVNITPANVGAVPVSGTTMTGALVGQANANYTTAQFRNITMSNAAPSGGSNGQVHFQYS